MHVSKVTYSQLFPLSAYLNERVGVEVDLNPGEDAKEALETAKKLCEEFHKENAPAQPKKEPTTRDQQQLEKDRLSKLIKDCTDMDKLYAMEKDAREYHLYELWRSQEFIIKSSNSKK